MQRANNLFERIPLRANLLLAVAKALRGKRGKRDAQAWVADLDANLQRLAEEIRRGELRVGEARQFMIHDPKERLITAPCFGERVLHHAVMNVCEPEFERRLVFHTYACRRGKGQFAALAAARNFAAANAWFLKMDVRKYFDSIPKAAMLERLGRVFAERRVLDLFARMLHAHRPGEPCGLPIGSLISQHCANLYLDAVDRLVTQDLGIGACVRYMDDFIVWAADKATLAEVREAVRSRLATLGLAFKCEPQLNRTGHGMNFLGHRVFARRVMPNHRSRTRFRRKLLRIDEAVSTGTMGEAEAQRSLNAVCAFVSHFGLAALRRRVMLASGRGL